MRNTSILSVLFLMLMTAVASAAQKVHFVVQVPADTPADAKVYLAGSLPATGEWKAGGVEMAKQADGSWTCDVELEAGKELEYKFTLGSWETVERKADDANVDNRKATIDASTTHIDAKVDRWAKDEKKPQ